MAIGRLRRDSAGASMERALRVLSPRTSLRALNKNKSATTTPKATSSSSAAAAAERQKIASQQSFGMESLSTAVPDNHVQGREKEEEAVKVAIRIRPLSNHNDPQVVGRAWKATREKNSIVEISSEKKSSRFQSASSNEMEYEFDKVFGEDTNTTEIYHELVGDIVGSVTDEGVNGTVFTYGQTSSGKTFTMRGDDSKHDSSIGIIQMASQEIFNSIQKEKSNNPNCECSVRVSYTEIYNEELRDLLNDSKRKTSTSLTIREDKRGSITVEGRKEVAVSSLAELMGVFRIGETNKSVGCTKMNDKSSRSHVIFQITLQKKTTLDFDDEKENDGGGNDGVVVSTTSTLNLVDLAGSESVRHTDAIGMQKKEGGMINQSLLTLSKVLMSLGKSNPGHINYRDSKLTRILKPALSGNALMAVICCITPSDKYREETKSTLQFATRAKLVKTNATSNETIENESDVVAKLRLENVRAKMEIRELREMAARLGQGISTEKIRSESNHSNSLLELESQLATANDIAASLERQVDELSSQKNDALDWIEELFAKVEVKENKIKDLLEERNHATRKNDDLEDRLTETLMSLEEATVRNEKLQADSEEAAEVVQSMDAEIKSIKGKVAREKQTADKLEELHSEVARVREDHDISQHTLRQVRADNEELRKDAESQIGELLCELEVLKSHQSATDRDNDKMARENEQLTSQIIDLEDTLRLARANNEELRNDSQEEINELMLEIKRLKSEQSAASSNNDEMVRENEQLTSDMKVLEDTLRQVRVDNEELRNDAENQINELTNKMRDLRDDAEKIEEEKRAMEQHIDKVQKETSQVKSLLESTSDDGVIERAQLYEKISSLERDNEELTRQLCDIKDVAKKHAGEKREMLKQIEQYEEDLSCCEDELSEAKTALKSKSDQVENDVRCVESKVIEEKERVIDGLRAKLSQPVSANDDLAEEINHLQKENDRLESERRRMDAELDEYQRNANELTSKLVGTQRLLDEAKQIGSDTEQLESERAELAERFNSANEKIDKMKAQLEQAGAKLIRSQQENVSLKERDNELRGSVSRIRELVEAMKRRNSELEEENDSLMSKGEALEKDISAALAERDDAHARKDKVFSERDMAVEEHEKAKIVLAAEFEADCETMRSKVDIMTTENKSLKDQIDILEAGKASFEYKSDRILERDNALVGQHERLKSEYKKQARKMVDLKEQVKALSLVVKRLDMEKEHFFLERATLKETIKTMRTRLRGSKNEPSPRVPSNNKKKATFFSSRQ